MLLVPPSLDEWLPQDHLARFIGELVDTELDLTRFYASHAKAKGQPPYNPRLMLRILLYGYCVGMRSSRELEKACTDVVAFRWLAAQQAPVFRSIARFRERHLAALGNVFLQALELSRAAGMLSLRHVVLDGTKVRANASRHKAMSYARLTSRQKVLADEISDLMAEAKTVDANEDARFGPGKRGDELPAELADRQHRAAALQAARESIEAEAADRPRAEAEKKARNRGDEAQDITGSAHTAAADAVPKPTPQRNFTDP
ncbi:transposase, partial [Arthrobacter rhombi]